VAEPEASISLRTLVLVALAGEALLAAFVVSAVLGWIPLDLQVGSLTVQAGDDSQLVLSGSEGATLQLVDAQGVVRIALAADGSLRAAGADGAERATLGTGPEGTTLTVRGPDGLARVSLDASGSSAAVSLAAGTGPTTAALTDSSRGPRLALEAPAGVVALEATDGALGLVAQDEHQRLVAGVRGGDPRLELGDDQGRARASLVLDGERSAMTLRDQQGKERAVVEQSEADGPDVRLHGR